MIYIYCKFILIKLKIVDFDIINWQGSWRLQFLILTLLEVELLWVHRSVEKMSRGMLNTNKDYVFCNTHADHQ